MQRAIVNLIIPRSKGFQKYCVINVDNIKTNIYYFDFI